MARKLTALVMALVVLSTQWAFAHAQTLDSKYFNETGHNVSGEFLQFYNSNTNALILFGYPITEEFSNKDGLRIQYFQRARFEYHAELPEGSRVTLTDLGKSVYQPTGTLDVPGSPISCRSFSTGHQVCFDFLKFFDAYGGSAQFGNPISAFEYHEDKLVQYFEKARFEWQPGNPENQRVVISDLGRIYFDQIKEDPGLLPPAKPLDNSQSAVLRLRAYAFSQKALVFSSDTQTLFVIVQDQNLQAVSGANCVATVTWPDEHKDFFSITTNSNGVGIIPVTFSNQSPGHVVQTDVACTLNNLQTGTKTSFRIWY